MEGVGGEDTIGNTESLLRQFSKEDVGGEEKMETLTCEDGVSDVNNVSNVGFSEDTPKLPADCTYWGNHCYRFYLSLIDDNGPLVNALTLECNAG